jgi:predicted O-methyltransferase YrrM
MRVPRLRLRERRIFYRSRVVRELASIARWRRRRREGPDLAHLVFHPELLAGPVQRDEALLLHALVRVVRPQTVLELGFYHGASAFNFLRALDDDARLYSFDIDPACEALARERFAHDPRFVFRLCSQAELTADDIDGRRADLVLLDAAHDVTLYQAALERLLPLMAPDAILAIHDTGTVPRELFPPGHWLLDNRERWVGDEYEHQPDEREFVNWIRDTYPEFAQLHLHSRRTIRCGLTLLQRSAPLPRPG